MNKYLDGIVKKGKGASTSTQGGRGGASAPAVKEKPGFPGAQLPGKAQPARNNGVKGCSPYADSKGI